MERLAGRVMLLGGWKRAAFAFAAGLLGTLALQPFGVFAVLFVSFPLLVWLLDGASGNPDAGLFRRWWPAFGIGWCFGFGYFLGGLWWLGNALLVEADAFAWALPFAVVGLPAALALFYGIACAGARILWSDGVGRIAALALGFALTEWLRGFLFTGFPWNAIGYAAMPVPLMMQSVRIVGMDAVNLLTVFVFAVPALFGTLRGLRIGIAAALMISAAHIGYGAYVLSAAAKPGEGAEKTVVRLVQPVIDQAVKLDNAARNEIFEKHLALTSALPEEGGARPDIIIWPETSLPFILTDNPDALLRIADVLEEGQTLVAGAVRAEDNASGLSPRYYNSIYVIDDKGQITGASDKVHLVPFGEYMPFQNTLEDWGIDPVAMPGGFSAAAARTLLTLPGGQSLYPLICYEAIFPDEIDAVASGADALLNVTNDAWFGNTPGPYQHFHQARLRAVETGLPLIRAANNGISAVVDPLGRVIDGLGYNVKAHADTILPRKRLVVLSESLRHSIFWVLCGLFLLVAGISRSGFILRDN